MSFTLPTIADIRNQALTVWANLDQTISTSRFSDAWIRAHALGNVIWGCYSYLRYVERQIFPDSSDRSNLERHANIYGITPKRATTSQSPAVALSGSIGAQVTAGLEMIHTDGSAFVTTSGGTVGPDGTVLVTANSTSTGDEANKEAGETLLLVAPPAGISAQVTVMESFTGGAPAESSADLLSRLLSRLKQPPAGGKETDFRAWALEVEGITRVWTLPHRRGLGTIDLVLMTASGAPSAGQIAAVDANIESKRPIGTYDFLVVTAEETPVDIAATVALKDGYAWEVVKPLLETAVASLFDNLGPGDTLYLSWVETAISNVPGVKDRNVTTPGSSVVANVNQSTVERLVAGVITLEES